MNNAIALFKQSFKPVGVLALFLFPTLRSSAQLNVATVGATYTINFDGTVAGVSNGTWAGTGFQPVPAVGRLNSNAWQVNGWNSGDLAFGGTQVTGGTDYTRGVSAGGTAVGGMYAFQGAPIAGRALGFQPGLGDWQPGNITLRVQNNTGAVLTAFDVAFNVYVRNDQDRSSTFNFAYSTDNVSYTFVPAVNMNTPGLATGPAWVLTPRSTTVSGFTVPNGDYFYIRWTSNYVSGVGGYDEIALDDIQVTGQAHTLVHLTGPTSASVMETAGTVPVSVSIINPSGVFSTSVDLVLLSGDAVRLNNYTTQTVTFPAGSSSDEVVTLTIVDNGACDGDFSNLLELQNVIGGVAPASIGSPKLFTLNVDDDETSSPERRQAFDGLLSDNWTMLSGFAGISADPGAIDVPANERILSSTSSFQVINIQRTLNLATVSVLGFSGVKIVARVSCTGNNASQGAESGDDVRFYVDVDGAGFPVTPDLTIAGNSNARWGFSTGVGVASTAVGVPAVFAPVSGGDRTTDGYSYAEIDIPDGTNTVALRVVARNNNTGERWSIDDVAITGVLCEPIYYSRANGSEANPVWSTSRTGLPAPFTPVFDKNATAVVQNSHVIVTTGSPIDLKGLAVESGGDLTLGGNTDLTIHGTMFTMDGAIAASDDDVTFVSDATVTIDGATTRVDFRDLNQDGAGVVVDVDTLRIHGTLQLNSGAFDANSREVQLASTATYTANLGPLAPGASYIDRLRVERYIPAGVTNWRLLCAPVLNKKVTDWTDDFITAGFPGAYYPNFYNPPLSMTLWPSVRKYEETNPGPGPNAGLIGVVDVNEPLVIGRGFAAWSGTTLTNTTEFVIDVRGIPQLGVTPVALPMTYTNTGAPAVDGLNLVGNPLPSPIDFGSISLGPDVLNSYIVFDPVSGTNATWNETLQLSIPFGALNGNIQSSQGFWIQATGPNFVTTVSESAKVTDPNGGGLFGGMPEGPAPYFRLRINGADAFYDEALVHLGVGEPATGAHDMHKFPFTDPLGPSIHTRSTDGSDLVLNAWGDLNAGSSIPVCVGTQAPGMHTLTFFDAQGVLGLTCMVLEDLLTGDQVALSEGMQHAFNIAAGASTTDPRFMVHIRPAITFSTTDATCSGLNDGEATALGAGPGPFDYTWMGPFGNVLSQEAGVSGASTLAGLAPGVYSVTISGSADCGALQQTFTIDAPMMMAAMASSSEASCADASDGSILLEIQGGVGPYEVTWSTGATGAALLGIGPGNYTATVLDGNGCELAVPSVNVGQGIGPTAVFEVADSLVFAGQAVEFFNYSTYGADYVWDFGDGSFSTDNEPYHSFALPGSYTVTLTVTVGDCSTTLSSVVEVNTSTGVSSHGAGNLQAWTDGTFLFIELGDWSGDLLLDIFSADGRMLLSRTRASATGRCVLELPELASGSYVVRARMDGEVVVTRIPIIR